MGEGWVTADELEVGDELRLASGEIIDIDEIEVERLEKPVKVYNLEVEDYHSYYVSDLNVLVHNATNKGVCHKKLLGIEEFDRKAKVEDIQVAFQVKKKDVIWETKPPPNFDNINLYHEFNKVYNKLDAGPKRNVDEILEALANNDKSKLPNLHRMLGEERKGQWAIDIP